MTVARTIGRSDDWIGGSENRTLLNSVLIFNALYNGATNPLTPTPFPHPCQHPPKSPQAIQNANCLHPPVPHPFSRLPSPPSPTATKAIVPHVVPFRVCILESRSALRFAMLGWATPYWAFPSANRVFPAGRDRLCLPASQPAGWQAGWLAGRSASRAGCRPPGQLASRQERLRCTCISSRRPKTNLLNNRVRLVTKKQNTLLKKLPYLINKKKNLINIEPPQKTHMSIFIKQENQFIKQNDIFNKQGFHI